MKQTITITDAQIRSYRLHTHHLAQKLPMCNLLQAAACGLQNSPPGAWETALFNRLEHCTLPALQQALYQDKSLLQAWSYRGVPVVFPTDKSDMFCSPLLAQADESPWIYTRGIPLALDFLQMSFDTLLPMVMEATQVLNHCTVQSKEKLDSMLAALVADKLPDEKRCLWNEPSMYGNPDKQTVGGAVVSFLLRPCAFHGLVVFGQRQGNSPTFTSFQNWIGHAPTPMPNAEKELARNYLHYYGPTTVTNFMHWLGCSPKQAKRLWNTVAEELTAVSVNGKTAYLLSADLNQLVHAAPEDTQLRLLGAHDPYLDVKDRSILLPDTALQKTVWKTAGNPNVIVKGGRIIGIWKTKTANETLHSSMTLFEQLQANERQALTDLAEHYATFRQLRLTGCSITENSLAEK